MLQSFHNYFLLYSLYLTEDDVLRADNEKVTLKAPADFLFDAVVHVRRVV